MRYRIFGRTGLKLSTLALGTGNFGTGWGYGSDRDQARAVFDAYRAGGEKYSHPASTNHVGLAEPVGG